MKDDLKKHIASIRWVGKLQPTIMLPNTQPMPLNSAPIRHMVERFFESGVSHHSAQGATLWALLDFLQCAKVSYVLEAHPGEGYTVRHAPGTNGS
ncbi:hypothetical protein [Caldimonas sp. KR1-144]|uniref:hypothetical protein n=1 Tax=Caldimonas sp. KR1-144 TaxID=3400911 RepID=UPI003C0957FE